MAFASVLIRKTGLGNQAKLLVTPAFVLLVVAMLILPLPPILLDFFFTFNIALSIAVLLSSLLTRRTLDLSSFPSLLLFTTLLRLSLNVASSRVVLMDGFTGPYAAGHVIEAFGHFMVGDNFTVGIVVFMILVTINFVVITKGSTRIAEVGARFMLDAMPGKQMAIDADLNAGLITEAQARERRKEVSTEADFYGAMDGAAKFVRGDAIAALIIMAVNLIGGLLVGVLQHHMTFHAAVQTYTLLAIGDGLVAQIPSLVVSTAAGVMVARVNTSEDVGEQVLNQLLTKPKILWLVAGVLFLLGIVPGMPNLIFLFFTAALGLLGWSLFRKQKRQAAATAAKPPKPAATTEASWDDVRLVDPVTLEVGHRLIPMIDEDRNGKLPARIRGIRKKFATEVGFLPPAVRIRDNLELQPNQYIVTVNDARVGTGEIQPDRWLAIDPGDVRAPIDGMPTTDPAFGLSAFWIAEDKRIDAQALGYTVVDANTVVATHVDQILHAQAGTLLGHAEVQKLLDKVAARDKALVDDLVPKVVPFATLQRVLRNLLDEDVPLRNLRSILEALSTNPDPKTSADALTTEVRVAIGPSITSRYFGDSRELRAILLDPGLADILSQATQNHGVLEPNLATSLLQGTERAVHDQEAKGLPPVLVVPAGLRTMLARFLRHRLPTLAVLSLDEIPGSRILRASCTVGASADAHSA
ncbi:MAG TPA: flagellar biosynthesis protein FlhA [Nevskiaceae bacterium]|nr:flagellar biosynthesis protein FlhA [Nevskiaceae bacterium]